MPPAGEHLLEFLRRRDEGEALDFEEFCAQRPALAPELRRLFARYEELARSASPLQSRAELASRAHAGAIEEEERARALLSELEASLAQRYELVREVGRGGMGVVLEADERPLGRRVAMKVLQGPGSAGRGTPARSLHPRVLARFLAEARVTGRLDHPGIVPVHELGIGADGAVYYTMPLVRGEELGAVIARSRRGEAEWSLARVLDVLVRVCEAVAFAHQKGVVHRDLKPANVMVGPFGETYVLDWGLARIAGDAEDRGARSDAPPESTAAPAHRRPALLTAEGDVLGTPAYMAPEQALGDSARVDARSDVYALGAILHELLAGRPPHVEAGETAGPREILARLRAGPPEPIAKLAPDAPAELVAICERATARSPSERYPSALALREDLRAFLEQRVVRAYESGALAELRKWVARNRALAASLAAALAILLAGAAALAHSESRRRAQAEEDRARTAAALEAEREQSYLASLSAASLHLRSGDTVAAREHLERCPPELREFEWHLLERRKDLARHTIEGSQVLTAVASDARGERVAVVGLAGELALLRRTDEGVERALRLGEGGALLAVAFAPDDRWVAAGGVEGVVRILDAASGELLAEHAQAAPVHGIAFHPSADALAWCLADGSAWMVEPASSGAPVELFRAPRPGVLPALAFAPDGTRLLLGAQSGALHLVDLAGGAARSFATPAPVRALDVSPDGARIATAHLDGRLRVWGLPDVQLEREARLDCEARALRFHPDGGRILCGGVDGNLLVFDARSGERLATWLGHTDQLLGLSVSADGAFAASVSADRSLRLWECAHTAPLRVQPAHRAPVKAAALGADGALLATGSDDRSVSLWDARKLAPLATSNAHTSWVSSVSIAGERAASASVDGRALVLDARTAEVLLEIAPGIGPAWAVALAPDARTVGVGFGEGSARLFDARSGEELAIAARHTRRVSSLAWARAGRLLLSASEDGGIGAFEVGTRSERSGAQLEGVVLSMALHAGALQDLLAVGLQDGSIRLFEVDEQGVRAGSERALLGHRVSVLALCFEPRGKRLFSSSVDGSLCVWDPVRARPLLSLRDGTGPQYALVAGAGVVLGGGVDGALRVYEGARASEESSR